MSGEKRSDRTSEVKKVEKAGEKEKKLTANVVVKRMSTFFGLNSFRQLARHGCNCRYGQYTMCGHLYSR